MEEAKRRGGGGCSGGCSNSEHINTTPLMQMLKADAVHKLLVLYTRIYAVKCHCGKQRGQESRVLLGHVSTGTLHEVNVLCMLLW